MVGAPDFDDEFASAAEWARQYRAMGLQIVPAWMPSEAPKGQSWKRPRIKDWRKYQDRLVGDEVFDPWYGHGGEHVTRINMGVICGTCSGNLLIIDLDVHKKPDAAQWWYSLLQLHNNGIQLETAEQRTGGGGFQKLFRAPNGYRCPTNRTSLGVDIRGQGGFAVLCPSLHDSGDSYHWLEGRSPWDDVGIAMAPDWLLEATEKLIREHGGESHTSRKTSTASPAGDMDGFKRQWDGREDRMMRLIWAAIVDWRRQCPNKPEEAEQRGKAAEKYLIYERLVTPRLIDAGRTKTDLLEEEGRGPSEFWRKWVYAMKQWDDEVAGDAAAPSKGMNEERTKGSGSYPSEEQNKKDKTGAQNRAKDSADTAQNSADDAQTAQNRAKPPDDDDDDDDDEFAKAPPKPGPLILTDTEFLKGFAPPDYLIDGMLQRSYLYSLTARTGHGKTAVAMLLGACVAIGRPFHGKQTEPGGVLFLAGENPDDIRARYLALADHIGFKPGTIPFYFIDGVINIQASMDRIRDEAAKIVNLSLIIVDTQAAFFLGDEGNSNEQQKWFAQLLRALIKLPGHPAVLVNCHPTKNATRDNLVPMGGSAFLNEVDANLTLWADDRVCVLGPHQDKWRGVTFEELSFELRQILCEALKDTKGRGIPSVVAAPITEEGATRRAAVADEDDKIVLRLLHAEKDASLVTIARNAGWFWPDGAPAKNRVVRICDRLIKGKLLYKIHGGKYRLKKAACRLIGVKWERSEDDDE